MRLLHFIKSAKNQTNVELHHYIIEKREVEEQFRQIVKKQLKLPVKLYSL